MAKAALNAIQGLNLLGDNGSPLMAIHVDPDAQYRNHVILTTLLPKESSSKGTDSALFCITGFPAFAIDSTDLCTLTERKVQSTLEGSRGFKRFLKDGQYTVKANRDKQFYDPLELEVLVN